MEDRTAIKHILLVSPLPPPEGGIATWTVQYQKYCAEHRISLSIVNSALIGSRGKKINDGRSLGDECIRTFRILKDFLRQLCADKPSLVHLNTSCSRFGIFRDLLLAIAARCFSVPVVLQCHCNIEDQLHGKAQKSAFRSLVRLSKRVLTLNRYSADYVAAHTKYRSSIVPNFVEMRSVREKKEIRPAVGRAVFVGHVLRAKGVEEILEAAKRLPSIVFVLVGPVDAHIEALEHPDNVVFMGAQTHESVLSELEKADIFVFPSHSEGFSVALLEAMGTGLPIVTTDVGANADMIGTDGGILVPVGDAAALAEAIRSLVHDAARRTAMSAHNIARVREQYRIDAVMKQLLKEYALALEDGR